MNLLTSGMTKWLGVSVIIVVLDQITKILAESNIALYERIAVMPFFNLTLAYNEGAAFSFLADAGGWQRWFFVTLTIVICGILILWLRKTDNKIEQWAISFVIGGAIGNNLLDRLLYGHVIDFLDVYYDVHHWPAFNIADIAISCGVALFILATFVHKPVSESNA